MRAHGTIASFSSKILSSTTESSERLISHDYLLGIRGILVIQSFIFAFFQIFLPAAVPESKNVEGPHYQIILRKSFSVIFCNGALIYSWIVFLSARSICLPYLRSTQKEMCASSIFRRNTRLWIPTFTAYSLAAAAFNASDIGFISEFLALTGNVSISPPIHLRNFLVYFNSLFDIFWVNKEYTMQAAVQAFPSGNLWIISLLFQQSYTVYMIMLIIPYTRKSWRVKAFLAIIVTAFWVHSWAWYSVTGLFIADAMLNMDFQARSRIGVKMGAVQVPLWPLYVLLVVVGFLMQFLTISWNPGMRRNELYGHTGLYTDGFLNENLDGDQPWGRIDNYLIIVGSMLLVETFYLPQQLLKNNFLVALGRRSFGVFLVQPIILYTAGIRLWMHLHHNGGFNAVNTLLVFVACTPLVFTASEAFYRIIDLPSIRAGHGIWAFMTK